MDTIQEAEVIFQQAHRAGNLQTIKDCLAKYPELANKKDERGYVPLIMAAYMDQVDLVKLLIAHGAEVDAQDISGNTALMGACFKGHLNSVKELLENGADPNKKNENGTTALAFACMFNQREIAEVLIDYKADVLVKDAKGHSVIDQAKMQGINWVEDLVSF